MRSQKEIKPGTHFPMLNSSTMSNLPYEYSSPQFVARRTEYSFIPALATVLTHLIQITPNNQDGREITRFHAVSAPLISINDYLSRIAEFVHCSNECFVLSLVYIDRIVKLHDGFVVNYLNIHRLLITSVMLAAKYFDDVYYPNSLYARVGGVETLEMNLLEAHFLSLINYQLFVSPEEYDQYRHNVEEALRPISSMRPMNPITHYNNYDLNDYRYPQHNHSRVSSTNRKPFPSTRSTNSPLTTQFNKRNVANQASNDHFIHLVQINRNKHISQEHSSQAFIIKREEDPNNHNCFRNPSCNQMNQDPNIQYFNNYPSYEAQSRRVIHHDDHNLTNDFTQKRFLNMRTSQSSIGYR